MLHEGVSESDSQPSGSTDVLAGGVGSSLQRAGGPVRRGGLVTSMTETIDRVRCDPPSLALEADAAWLLPRCWRLAGLLTGANFVSVLSRPQEYDIGSNTAPALS